MMSVPTAKDRGDGPRHDPGIEARQQSNPSGLTSAEASDRLTQYGPNDLAEEGTHPWRTVLGYFWGPVPWMIEIAAALSAVIGHWVDLAIIVTMLLTNAGISLFEQRQATSALAALKGQLALTARVRRDGAWGSVPAAELVPGDLIGLRLGEVIPADATLSAGDYLSVDQSSLTGESLPVAKGIGDEVYSGSVVKQGDMTGVVTATGRRTFFGKTADLVQHAGSVSHFQQAVTRVGNFLILLAVGLSAVLVIAELRRGTPVLQITQYVLILVIAAIPVAMPAVLSITMALGAQALARRQAIVSTLPSIEELAGVDVLCTDKTGTLTQNTLTASDPILVAATTGPEVLRAAAWASKAEDEDTIDLAILAAAKRAGAKPSAEGWQRTAYVPFDPVHKRTEATLRTPSGAQRTVTKGAPRVVIDLCELTSTERARAQDEVATLADHGMRTLAVARRDGEGPWRLLGLVPLSDPPRADSKATIAGIRRDGVAVHMITGDDAAIARRISTELGIGERIEPASSLFEADTSSRTADTGDGRTVDDAALARLAGRVEATDGFAQVFPEHKYEIVRALQHGGHLVAMTGDGVNDAPALKQADVGIAVSGATQAARSAADVVLAAPGLSVIADAIDQARRIFGRMTSYTVYRIAMTIDVMFFVVLAILIWGLYPMTAVMIIVLALLDDLPIMTIAFDRAEGSARPARWQLREVLGLAGVLGLLSVAQTLALWLLGSRWLGLDTSHLQSLAFLQLVVGGHLLLLSVRNRGPLWAPPHPSRTLLFAVLATQVFAVAMVLGGWLVPPLGWSLVGLVWAYDLAWLVLLDAVKLSVRRVLARRTDEPTPARREPMTVDVAA